MYLTAQQYISMMARNNTTISVMNKETGCREVMPVREYINMGTGFDVENVPK